MRALWFLDISSQKLDFQTVERKLPVRPKDRPPKRAPGLREAFRVNPGFQPRNRCPANQGVYGATPLRTKAGRGNPALRHGTPTIQPASAGFTSQPGCLRPGGAD